MTDKEALALVPRHPDSWLRRYVAYAAERTDAPIAFHLCTGLGVLAANAGHRLQGQFTGSKLSTNLWVMVVGSSGDARKTTALRIGTNLLKSVQPESIGEPPGSEEGLVDQLADQENQLIIYGEFGQFLEKSQIGYLSALKTRYTQVYDGDPVGRMLAKKRKSHCENPRLSMLAGTTLEFLETFTTTVDWQAGFLNRFFIVVAARERNLITPTEDPAEQSALEDRLRELQLGPLGRYGGFTPQAVQLWEKWNGLREIAMSRPEEFVPALTQGLLSRQPTLLLKIAMLLAYDTDSCRAENWKLSEDNIRSAAHIVKIQAQSAAFLAKHVSESSDRRDRRTVLNCLNGVAVSMGDLIKRSRIQKRKLYPVLDSLVEEGTLSRESDTSGVRYRKLDQAG
jgi:hypothetical protein